MVRVLAIILALVVVPYLVISKSQQLKKERQAKIRYLLFIGLVVAFILVIIKIL